MVSITTLLLLLEKIKLAVLQGDFWGSFGDVGEFKLRRDAGPVFDLAAVLRRMASCRFMEGEAVMAGGDLFAGVGEAGITKTEWVSGRASCSVSVAGGEAGGEDVVGGEYVVGGERIIRDLLMGF